MKDRQLKKNLLKLQEIKPDKEWAFSVKQNILGQKEMERFHLLHLHGQAFLAGSLAIIALVFLAVFGTVFFKNNSLNSFSDVDLENLTSSLRGLETSLNDVTSYLKVTREPAKVLEVEEMVSSAIEEGSQFVAKTKEKTEKMDPEREGAREEVLSALTDVEVALSEMQQTKESIQQEVAGREIAELEKSALTEEQKKLLGEAKEYFAQGSYPQALMKIIELSQNR